jgi:hypothetical protein
VEVGIRCLIIKVSEDYKIRIVKRMEMNSSGLS